jgi:hypothetical protein
MKQLIEKARSKIVTLEQMLDSGISCLVRNGERDPEPLEIGNAILKDVQAQIVRDAFGNAMFPHAHVVVELLPTALPPGASLEPLAGDRLQTAMRRALAELDCRVPSNLSLEIRRLLRQPDDWRPGSTYRLLFHDGSRRACETRGGDRVLTLTFASDPEPHTRQMRDGRLNIGSVAEVRDHDGRLVRRNAVCISGEHDPKRAVSRCHAHITASVDAHGRVRYALHDDASTYGTRVVRGGDTIAALPGTSGVRLRDGDEVYFGAVRAAVSISDPVS